MSEKTTESTAKRYVDTHNWPSEDLVEGILEAQASGIAAVQSSRDQIVQAIDQTTERLTRGGRLVFTGAGTSGRIAAQDATELLPTYNWPADRAIVLMAGGTDALFSSIEGAEDSIESAESDITAIAPNKDDVVIGVAASGNTPYTLKCLEIAKRNESFTIGIFNNVDCQMSGLVDCPIPLNTGAEFVTGSTRMKAGTSQKAVLNTLTTSVMIKLGRVYRGQMIDMPATNNKLTARCIRIVSRICECSRQTSEDALTATGWNVKIAIVMISNNVNSIDAQQSLNRVNGLLRDAIEPRSNKI